VRGGRERDREGGTAGFNAPALLLTCESSRASSSASACQKKKMSVYGLVPQPVEWPCASKAR
jgi:hypothetical protein